ncbi:hypothetical protein LXL04_008193 [Taraxacum kok-saghyz]
MTQIEMFQAEVEAKKQTTKVKWKVLNVGFVLATTACCDGDFLFCIQVIVCMFRGVVTPSNLCLACNCFPKSADHLFLRCSTARALRARLFLWWPKFPDLNMCTDVHSFLQGASDTRLPVMDIYKSEIDDMEVVLPRPVSPTDFNFNSSAYGSAPSTPRLIGDCYFSAPTSPTRVTDLYREFDELLVSDDAQRFKNSFATVPFAWEERPGVPKSVINLFKDDFAFDVSGELHRDSSAAAEDLFDDGVIKSRDLPPPVREIKNREIKTSRGRQAGLPSSRSRRTRSLPPVRALEQPPARPPTDSTCTTLSACGSGKGSRKWSFKDLFLFRSASDGRAMDRDPLKKYSAIFRKHDEDLRNSSIRSDRSGSGSGSHRRGRVSAHELHYTVNRAVSNDMKKKTFLPYKQGILGRLAFNPTVHALSNGFGSPTASLYGRSCKGTNPLTLATPPSFFPFSLQQAHEPAPFPSPLDPAEPDLASFSSTPSTLKGA